MASPFGLVDDYDDVRPRIDNIKAAGEKDNPFNAPLMTVTFAIRLEGDESTHPCEAAINALNVSYLYSTPE